MIAAAIEARATEVGASRPGRALPGGLTAAEQRVLKLLPASTHPQMAAALHVSRTTAKTHLRSIDQKLGAASRSEAIERAIDLGLL